MPDIGDRVTRKSNTNLFVNDMKVSASNPIPVDTAPVVATLSTGNPTVSTAGTRVQLSSNACNRITIVANRANTGYIYVGGSDVSSTVHAIELQTKDTATFYVSNTNQLWIDSSVNGEGVSFWTS